MTHTTLLSISEIPTIVWNAIKYYICELHLDYILIIVMTINTQSDMNRHKYELKYVGGAVEFGTKMKIE